MNGCSPWFAHCHAVFLLGEATCAALPSANGKLPCRNIGEGTSETLTNLLRAVFDSVENAAYGCTMLKNGAQLRFPIKDSRGILLIAQGSAVTERLRQILAIRGISLEIQASLHLLEGGQQGLEIPVNKQLFRIGRRPDCDLQLASHVVSGHHCLIQKRSAGVILKDLQSSNGTFLNGERLDEADVELNDQDTIRVGHFLFEIRIFAALAAATGAGEQALNAWILEETSSRRKPATPYCPTAPDIDLSFVD
jgi:hypothetical protein